MRLNAFAGLLSLLLVFFFFVGLVVVFVLLAVLAVVLVVIVVVLAVGLVALLAVAAFGKRPGYDQTSSLRGALSGRGRATIRLKAFAGHFRKEAGLL